MLLLLLLLHAPHKNHLATRTGAKGVNVMVGRAAARRKLGRGKKWVVMSPAGPLWVPLAQRTSTF